MSNPSSSAAIQAWALFRQGDLDGCASACAAILAAGGQYFDAHHLLGLIAFAKGDFGGAEAHLRNAVAVNRNSYAALRDLGRALQFQDKAAAAADAFSRALAAAEGENRVEAEVRLGSALVEAGRLDEAAAHLARALDLDPTSLDARYNLGVVHERQGDHDKAITAYREVAARNPGYGRVLAGLGRLLRLNGAAHEAIEHLTKAVTLNAEDVASYAELSVALFDEHRDAEGEQALRRAEKLRPKDADTLTLLGGIYLRGQRRAEAMSYFNAALAADPRHADAMAQIGRAFAGKERFDEAVGWYRKALAVNPDFISAHMLLAHALIMLRRTQEAIACYDEILKIEPTHVQALSMLHYSRRYACVWDDGETQRRFLSGIAKGLALEPFAALLTTDDPAVHLQSALRHWERIKQHSAPLPAAPVKAAGRIRLGYVSADFRKHPVAQMVAPLFELHDRARFEIIAISTVPDDGTIYRRSIEKSVDRFVDASGEDDKITAKIIRDLGIHILTDLSGFTEKARAGILAYRPAPIQAHYLGYPGPMGSGAIDYMIVDDVIVPKGMEGYYTEKLVHLPRPYQVNDPLQRPASAETPTRTQCGLPSQGFVFCSLNNAYKITPEVFGIWMRILRAVPGSALWLLSELPHLTTNLKREAEKRGVAAERIVVSSYLELPEHLARHRHADLFLDTWPYNAHTTASDALWMGVPIITYPGRSFASRVAASLLHGVGLPELVTQSWEEYEATAIRLAQQPDELRKIRGKLQANLATATLFDSCGFCRDLEAAYETMWARHMRGEAPASFAIR